MPIPRTTVIREPTGWRGDGFLRLPSWFILILAFGSLLALLCVSGLATIRRSRQVYAKLLALNEAYRQNERCLDQIRTGISESNVLVRDYLLDLTFLKEDRYRKDLRGLRENTIQQLDELKRLRGPANAAHIDELRREVELYWASLDPVLRWPPQHRQYLSFIFLRKNVMPLRDRVLGLTAKVEEINKAALDAQKQGIAASELDFKAYAKATLTVTATLGLIIAIVCVWRVLTLERRSERQRLRAEQAEGQLRGLSTQLVHAQEAERKSISRELHDEVGQMLTGLRMELSVLHRLHSAAGERFDARLASTKTLLDRTMQAVRDIAMGLRPSMLDDLGLGAALEWQARDFSRRYDIPVTLEVSASLDRLPDHHRTNIFRIVQEALTNCARHARATGVRIAVAERDGSLQLTISDDGAGFTPAEGGRGGLGLLGIEERARELGGHVAIRSHPGGGTLVAIDIPTAVEKVGEPS